MRPLRNSYARPRPPYRREVAEFVVATSGTRSASSPKVIIRPLPAAELQRGPLQLVLS